MFILRAQMGVHVSLYSSEVTSDARDLERVAEKLQSWEALAEHFMRTAAKYASLSHVLTLNKTANTRAQLPTTPARVNRRVETDSQAVQGVTAQTVPPMETACE